MPRKKDPSKYNPDTGNLLSRERWLAKHRGKDRKWNNYYLSQEDRELVKQGAAQTGLETATEVVRHALTETYGRS